MRLSTTMIWSAALFVLFIVIMAGCKSVGSGTGESDNGEVQVRFTWQQSDPLSGTLTAMVSGKSGSETYQGTFYQITRNSRIETLGPLWHPWYPAWRGWPHWDPVPEDSFITHYTGHVLANLAGPDGKRVRCEFQLLRADEGMKGGGEGRCQLPSGLTIRASFPPS